MDEAGYLVYRNIAGWAHISGKAAVVHKSVAPCAGRSAAGISHSTAGSRAYVSNEPDEAGIHKQNYSRKAATWLSAAGGEDGNSFTNKIL